MRDRFYWIFYFQMGFKYFDNIIEKDIGSVIAAYGCNDLCGIALMKKLHWL